MLTEIESDATILGHKSPNSLNDKMEKLRQAREFLLKKLRLTGSTITLSLSLNNIQDLKDRLNDKINEITLLCEKASDQSRDRELLKAIHKIEVRKIHVDSLGVLSAVNVLWL